MIPETDQAERQRIARTLDALLAIATLPPIEQPAPSKPILRMTRADEAIARVRAERAA